MKKQLLYLCIPILGFGSLFTSQPSQAHVFNDLKETVQQTAEDRSNSDTADATNKAIDQSENAIRIQFKNRRKRTANLNQDNSSQRRTVLEYP